MQHCSKNYTCFNCATFLQGWAFCPQSNFNILILSLASKNHTHTHTYTHTNLIRKTVLAVVCWLAQHTLIITYSSESKTKLNPPALERNIQCSIYTFSVLSGDHSTVLTKYSLLPCGTSCDMLSDLSLVIHSHVDWISKMFITSFLIF